MPIFNKECYNSRYFQIPENFDIESPCTTTCNFFLSSKTRGTRVAVIISNSMADSNSVRNNRNQSHPHQRSAATFRVFICVYACTCSSSLLVHEWMRRGVYLCSICTTISSFYIVGQRRCNRLFTSCTTGCKLRIDRLARARY